MVKLSLTFHGEWTFLIIILIEPPLRMNEWLLYLNTVKASAKLRYRHYLTAKNYITIFECYGQHQINYNINIKECATVYKECVLEP